MPQRTAGFPSRSAALAVFATVAAFGCAPRADGADEAPAAASAAASTATAIEIAAWRATVSRLHAEVAELSRNSAASAEASQSRLRALTDDLAALEQRIAAHTPSASGPTQAGKIVVDDVPAPLAQPKLDEQVEPARLEAASGAPLPGHKFAPAVKRAKASLEAMKSIKDYTAVMVKQERIDGKLNEMEFMHAKIRHEPFSVYLRFLAPHNVRDREVIYIAGQNDGNLIAHESPNRGLIGILAQSKLVGPTSLAPTSTLAMMGNRYPITEIGVLNLTRRLIEVGEKDMRFAGADAKYYPDAKVEGRACEAYVFVHPTKRKEFTFHRAEVFIDKELNLPIRYASYDWPAAEGETPPLIETYTYTRLKLNVGLTDEDFDVKNPKYKFPN